MTMTNCNACEADISQNAEACPKCGEPNISPQMEALIKADIEVNNVKAQAIRSGGNALQWGLCIVLISLAYGSSEMILDFKTVMASAMLWAAAFLSAPISPRVLAKYLPFLWKDIEGKRGITVTVFVVVGISMFAYYGNTG